MKARTVLAACMILCGLAVALVVPALVHADTGHRDGVYTSGTSGPPTTSKPESKVWFSHGMWWAVMARKVASGGNTYFIFRLNAHKQKWINTHVVVDTRDSTRQDALSVGNKLFIASHKHVQVSHNAASPDPRDEMRLFLFSWNPGTRKYAPAGEQAIDGQKSETLVIDRDSTGVIWATWVQADSGGQHHVYAKPTDGDCVGNFANCTFGGPAGQLDASGVSPDDISSVVNFGGDKIGVMWSDTTDKTNDKIMFAIHQDGDPLGTWSTETAIGGPKMADDHINLKSDSNGRIFATTKTKFRGETKPGTMLLRRTTNGSWKHFTISRASLAHTRPIVLLDQRHSRIRVFEGSTHNDAIFMKKTRLGHPSFAQFKAGARVIKDSDSEMGNPTSTKQGVGANSHFPVLATNAATKRYWHAWVRTRH